MPSNILFLTALPPPIHGVSFINKIILEKIKVDNRFNFSVVKLNNTTNLSELGKVNIGKLLFFFHVIKEIRKAKKKTSFDLIYFSISSAGFALFRDIILLFYIKKVIKTKILLHVRGRDYIDYKKRPFIKYLLRKTFSNTYIIQHSERVCEDIDWIKASFLKRYFLANGVLAPTINTEQKKNNSKVKILYLSMKTENKGIWVFLEAINLLKKKHLDFEIDFVGGFSSSDDEKKYLEKIKGLGLEKYFNHFSTSEGIQKETFFRNADIFVFPTLRESFGNVVIEAMSYGLPVVASAEGSLLEIVKNNETGLLFEKGNACDLADKLELLILNKELQTNFGKAGHKRFCENYTFDIFLNNFTNIITSILQQK